MSSDRWKPTRAGICNVWEYDEQVFHFADGRLVLRGPNGSGKSNALALLVPFLLDGVMSAARMDSMGGGRSMKSLLLGLSDDEASGRRYRHEQRTGYVWLEFGRGDEHVTIGCGARAVVARDTDAWFFVTDRRPGVDLELTRGGVALTRAALTEELGADAVSTGADDYRRAVDRALLGLGPHRHRNLLALLVVLRRPHLAGNLKLDLLARVLSEGLPFLDEQLLVDVAASFEDLDAVKKDLERLEAAQRAVDGFLPTYRRYVRAMARERATAVVRAGRDLRAAEGEVRKAADAVGTAEHRIAEVRELRHRNALARTAAEQRLRALLESPAYRDATSLVEVVERAGDAERETREAADRLRKAEARVAEAETSARDATEALRQASAGVDRVLTETAAAADVAGVPWTLDRQGAGRPDLEAALRAGATRRREDIRMVGAAAAAADRTRAQAESLRAVAQAAADEATAADGLRVEAAAATDAARFALFAAVTTWAGASGLDGLDPVLAGVGTMGDPAAPTLADVLAEVLAPRREALAAERALLGDRRETLARQAEEVEEERRRVAEWPVPTPDRLSTRPADRDGRPGAPLFACCDFADNLGHEERAGLEAALEAAGMLDAWVGLVDDGFDAWVHAGPPVDGPSLADVLVPTPPPESGLGNDDVAAVLRGVALADVGIGLSTDGRFVLGPLAGRFGKPGAEFVGAGAREQRRLRLLAELDERLHALRAELSRVDGELERLAADEQRMAAASDSLPSAAELVAAREAFLQAVARCEQAEATAARARAEADAADGAARDAAARHQTEAADRRLPTTEDGLAQAEHAVHAFEQQASELVAGMAELDRRRAAAGETDTVLQRERSDRDGMRREHEEKARRHAGLSARVETLRAQLGPDAGAPLREQQAIDAEQHRLAEEETALGDAAEEAAEELGRARTQQEATQQRVEERRAAMSQATARVDALRAADLWAVVVGADVEVPSDPQRLAQQVDAATVDVDAAADANALQNQLERAFRALLDEIGREYQASLGYVDGIGRVDVTSEAGTFAITWLAQELAAHVARQRELLSERDRAIFERHLLSRVAEALRELLNDADEFVSEVNACLDDTPTASGLRIQLRWEAVDDGPATVAALHLLRRSPELLGPEEREELRRFFADAIARARADNPGQGYAEVLAQVLDYRSWHTFALYVLSARDGRRRLTKTVFRSLSGGEQAIALHLPLFAAAAAHYNRARPDAPRMIALDEAFAGIDEGMRGDLLGLLGRFDLDMVLTGHELWGAYEQVPAVMVYDLLRRPPAEGVSCLPMRWDGAALAAV